MRFHMSSQGEHGLGRGDGVVKPPVGNLAPEANLQSESQAPELLDFWQEQPDAVALGLEEDLPVGSVQPSGVIGLAKSAASVAAQLLQGKLLERHLGPFLAILLGVSIEEEMLLFHEAFQIPLNWVAPIHLLEIGQELIFQSRLGSEHRMDFQNDKGLRWLIFSLTKRRHSSQQSA